MDYNTSKLFEGDLITLKRQLNKELDELQKYEQTFDELISNSERKNEIKSNLRESKKLIIRQINYINKALIQII